MKNKNKKNFILLAIILCLIIIDFILFYKINQTKRDKTEREAEVEKIIKEKADKQKIKTENEDEREYTEEREEIKPRIAIIIDDLGYTLERGERLLEIDFPFTVSILPNLPHSRSLAERAEALGKEVILHLPMEPYNSERRALEKDTLLVSMSKDQILELIYKALENVSGAVGVNNHQGSRMVEDVEKMEIILEEFGKRGLFFWTVGPAQRILSEKLPQNLA